MISKIKNAFFKGIFSDEIPNERGLRIASTILGVIFFFTFFIIAWVYYQERMIPYDGAFYCFKMIDAKSFNLELGRIGAVTSQLLPWISLQFDSDLETIIRLYSVNFILVQFVIFIVLVCFFKDFKAVLALLLALCLGYRYQFYYTVSEIHQTIAPLLLIFALVNSSLLFSTKRKDKIVFIVTFIMVCAWLANIHMLALVLISFVVAYAIIENSALLFKKELWLSIVGGYSVFIYKLLSISKGSYDDSKMITVEKLKLVGTQLSEIPSFIFFRKEFLSNYYILVFAAFVLFTIYIYKKKWLALAFIIASLLGFFVLTIAYNTQSDSPVVYQNYYACFGPLIAIPLVVELVSVFQVKIVAAFVGILLITSTLKIIQCGRMYEMRMEYFSRIEQNVKGLPESKFMVFKDNINWNMIWVDWNLGFETLIHSAIASPDSAMTFTTASNYADYDSMMYRPNTFIGVRFSPYWFTSENMSQRYFRIKNTPYRILNKIPQDSLANSEFSSSTIELDFQHDVDISLPYFRYQIIPVEIRNNSVDTLFSKNMDNHNIALGYKLYCKDGELINTVPIASAIEVDVYPHTHKITGIQLDYLKRGTYIIEVGLVYQKSKWLKTSKKKTITIY